MGALTQDLFSMIVTMAVLTTIAMPPSLRWALSRIPLRQEEKQRIEREELEEKGFVPKLERLLIAIDGSKNGEFAVRIGGIIAGNNEMPTTVMHIQNGKKGGKTASLKAKAKDEGAKVEAVAERAEKAKPEDEKADNKVDVTTVVEKPSPEAIAEEAEKGYGLMVIGLAKTVARGNEFHDHVTSLADGFEGPLAVADARNGLLKRPLETKLDILVPVNGTDVSRRAAEVAIAIARASKAPLTALYVAQTGKNRRRSRRNEEAILKDIAKLAETYHANLKTAVRADIGPDQAILKQLARSKHNLVIMGVGRRPGEKLFFGDTAAAVLEKSESSLLFVAT
jgi:nucleotide-binding universal stress UspA family protein